MTFDLREFLKHLWCEYGWNFCVENNYHQYDELPDFWAMQFEQYIRNELDALDMVSHLCEFLAEQKALTPDPVALIAFLAAKLACYEPDSPTVKRALEYLECHT